MIEASRIGHKKFCQKAKTHKCKHQSNNAKIIQDERKNPNNIHQEINLPRSSWVNTTV